MPTTTALQANGGLYPLEFRNIGPLTSVWTTPTAACSTVPVATSGLAMPFQSLVFDLLADNCKPYEFHAECEPNGEELKRLIDEHEPSDPFFLEYHSPGLHCPDSRETVGVIAMNNGTPSATGLFSPTIFTYVPEETQTFPPGDFLANMLHAVLAPTETAIACCPSGYTADPWAGCHSTFSASELAGETVCRTSYTGTFSRTGTVDVAFPTGTEYTFDFFGATGTGTAFNITAMAETNPTDTNSENYATETATFDALGTPIGEGFEEDGFYASNVNRTGLSIRQPIYLVNSGEGAAASDGGDQPAAAGRIAMPGSSWTAVGAVLTAWGVGMAAGVGLLAAW